MAQPVRRDERAGVTRLKDLETENAGLKKLLAEQVLENEVIKDALRKSAERTGPTRAGAQMTKQGLNARRALCVVRMSASAYRHAMRPDRNVELRQQIVALAQRHKRYGVGMIHLKLRRAGLPVNYQRVERLYVAVLGRSSYAYAGAMWAETLPDWIGAHVCALDLLGGAPLATPRARGPALGLERALLRSRRAGL